MPSSLCRHGDASLAANVAVAAAGDTSSQLVWRWRADGVHYLAVASLPPVSVPAVRRRETKYRRNALADARRLMETIYGENERSGDRITETDKRLCMFYARESSTGLGTHHSQMWPRILGWCLDNVIIYCLKTKLSMVFLCCKSQRFETVDIKTVSANSTQTRWLAHLNLISGYRLS